MQYRLNLNVVRLIGHHHFHYITIHYIGTAHSRCYGCSFPTSAAARGPIQDGHRQRTARRRPTPPPPPAAHTARRGGSTGDAASPGSGCSRRLSAVDEAPSDENAGHFRSSLTFTGEPPDTASLESHASSAATRSRARSRADWMCKFVPCATEHVPCSSAGLRLAALASVQSRAQLGHSARYGTAHAPAASRPMPNAHCPA